MEDEELVEFQPDIHTLFITYNTVYFEGLLSACLLEWSDKMTLCAGICYSRATSQTRHCTIRLSRPLLQYRPYPDTINTLLHEMIHAYIFIKFGGSLQRDGHGPDFQAIMARINGLAGTNITIYHGFHDEVRACRKHVWRCDGPCRDRAPFYGWCRRAMNRAPQPADTWWVDHQRSCGGTFHKISGPEVPTKAEKKPEEKGGILDYFKRLGKGRRLGGDETKQNHQTIIDLTDD